MNQVWAQRGCSASQGFPWQHPCPTKVLAKANPPLKRHLTSRHFSHPGIWIDSPIFHPELHLAFRGITRFSLQPPQRADGSGNEGETFLRLSTPGLNLDIPCLKLLFFPSLTSKEAKVKARGRSCSNQTGFESRKQKKKPQNPGVWGK